MTTWSRGWEFSRCLLKPVAAFNIYLSFSAASVVITVRLLKSVFINLSIKQ